MWVVEQSGGDLPPILKHAELKLPSLVHRLDAARDGLQRRLEFSLTFQPDCAPSGIDVAAADARKTPLMNR